MNSMSVMLSVSNYARTAKLTEEQQKMKQDLTRGMTMVKHIQQNISEQGDQLETVKKNIKVHDKQVGDLNERLTTMAKEYGQVSRSLKSH